VSIDIEERMLSEDALKDSEARYRRLFETAQGGILILDATTGAITDANPFLVELLGYSHAEFLGMALWDADLFKDVEESKNAFRHDGTRAPGFNSAFRSLNPKDSDPRMLWQNTPTARR